MNGKVKWFNAKNHFGFIEGEDSKDYFVHISALKPGTKLFENDQVSFDPIEGERGLQAQNVSKTGKGGLTEVKKDVSNISNSTEEVAETSETTNEPEEKEESEAELKTTSAEKEAEEKEIA